MLPDTFKIIFKRDLEQLKEEINLFEKEPAIWVTAGDIKNSAGNLCLHIVGNLNAYIGVGLAKTNYIRNRDSEFLIKGVPKNTLIQQVEDTIKIVLSGLDQLTEKQLSGNFPLRIWDKPTGMEYTLIQLACHLNYHLGQINYLRRFLDRNEK